MTQRERRLAIGVGGVVALWAGFVIVKAALVNPFQRQHTAIQTAKAEIARLEKRANVELGTVKRDYRLLTNQTLARDPDVALARFRDDLSSLLDKHGFAKRDDFPLSLKPSSKTKNKEGLWQLPMSVTTKGKLKDLVALLVDLYRRDYLVKIETLTVSADAGRKSLGPAGGRRSRNAAAVAAPPDANGPDLSISFVASTLALPVVQDIAHEPMKEVRESAQGRLQRDPKEYDAIVAQNIFSEYVPPPIVVAPPPQTEPPPAQPDAEPPPVADATPPAVEVDPRQDAGHFKLIGTTSLRGNPQALVTDDRKITDPPLDVALNTALDDGIVVLIHPRGIVIRATQGKFAGGDFFYKLGNTFADRILLNADEYPDVAADLKVALRMQ